MRPKIRDMLVLFGTPALVGAALVVLLFTAVRVFGATTTILTDAPCSYAAGVLDCRATQPPPPPPPGDLCAGKQVLRTTWDWAAGNRTIDTASMGGIGAGILVVEFIPTHPADVDNLARISVVEYPANALVTSRVVAISTRPCDLVGLPPGPAASTGPSLQYGVGTVSNSAFTGKPRGVALMPGVRYWINVSAPGCAPTATTSCDARVTLFKPSGH